MLPSSTLYQCVELLLYLPSQALSISVLNIVVPILHGPTELGIKPVLDGLM